LQSQRVSIRQRFYKLSGGGNDFVALADPESDPRPEAIRAICQRGTSVGADGVFVIRREEHGILMHYWNADGNPSGLCLNGTRCAAQLAHHLGWCTGTFPVVTGAGAIDATAVSDDTVTLDVPLPLRRPEEVEISLGGDSDETWVGWTIRIGVPHVVIFWPSSLAEAPVEDLGAAIRWAAEFSPSGTNVDFIRFPSPDQLEIRTYERGVEAETLACGTGILASTIVGLARGVAKLPLRARTMGGFPFEVSGEARGGRPTRWSLTGDARIVVIGELQPAAVVSTETPEWTE
jgi:diaminopimelate epimerase